MLQLIAHLFGDYVFQNQWMADNKTKSSFACLVHATVYALMFVICIDPHIRALALIWSTHFFIDRYRLAAVWVNLFKVGVRTDGEPVPPFLAVWLLIIVDNTFHMTINWLSLRYL